MDWCTIMCTNIYMVMIHRSCEHEVVDKQPKWSTRIVDTIVVNELEWLDSQVCEQY